MVQQKDSVKNTFEDSKMVFSVMDSSSTLDSQAYVKNV